MEQVMELYLWRKFQNAAGILEILTLSKSSARIHLEDKMIARIVLTRSVGRCKEIWSFLYKYYEKDTSKAPFETIKACYPMQLPLPVIINSNSNILLVGDYFTKWMEAYAIWNQEAATVA